MNGTLTSGLLLPIARNRTNNSILLSTDTIRDTLGVALGLSSLVLGFALSVFLFTRLLPSCGSGEVTDGLDEGALGGVVLTGGLTDEDMGQRSFLVEDRTEGEGEEAYFGSPVLLEDMMVKRA
ncbi:unnamed protein product [Somion occarium]|uniref:Uncharacterized protein n=1 Tax=Somion occarium TaxID=3059160 RepID=A0ABP1CP22_9APHY